MIYRQAGGRWSAFSLNHARTGCRRGFTVRAVSWNRAGQMNLTLLGSPPWVTTHPAGEVGG